MNDWAAQYIHNMKRVNRNAQEREKKRTMDATGATKRFIAQKDGLPVLMNVPVIEAEYTEL